MLREHKHFFPCHESNNSSLTEPVSLSLHGLIYPGSRQVTLVNGELGNKCRVSALACCTVPPQHSPEVFDKTTMTGLYSANIPKNLQELWENLKYML
jgi:hypothetical protein